MTTMRQIVQKHLPTAILSAPKPSKYGNRKVVVDGLMFDSQAEAKRWGELKLLELAGEITDLKRQVPMDCVVNGKLVCKYIADFTYTRKDPTDKLGLREIVEDVKGMETALFRLKAKIVEACHGVRIELVKVRR